MCCVVLGCAVLCCAVCDAFMVTYQLTVFVFAMPGWDGMVGSWAAQGTRVLNYISPFFSDPTGFTDPSEPRNNFYQQGLEGGYFVKHADGSPYKLYSLSIEFCMLDPTNPAGRLVCWCMVALKWRR